MFLNKMSDCVLIESLFNVSIFVLPLSRFRVVTWKQLVFSWHCKLVALLPASFQQTFIKNDRNEQPKRIMFCDCADCWVFLAEIFTNIKHVYAKKKKTLPVGKAYSYGTLQKSSTVTISRSRSNSRANSFVRGSFCPKLKEKVPAGSPCGRISLA